jgi:hypothetical protein
MKSLIIIGLCISVLLAGCTPNNNIISTRVARTIAAMPSATSYPTLTPYSTLTPYPTYTQAPESTVIPTVEPTRAFAKWNSDQVLGAFVNAGLEVGPMRWMKADDYGEVPMLAMDGTRFFIPSLCADCGGRIFAFDNQAGLDATAEYYSSLNQSDPASFSWIFMKDNIIVQLNGDTPEALARKYEAALNSMP